MAANGRSPHCPPAKSPFAENTLDAPRITANSRFLTKCYLLFATKVPNTRRPYPPGLPYPCKTALFELVGGTIPVCPGHLKH
jgi:hypothetical protein